jgi:hypothetical protein
VPVDAHPTHAIETSIQTQIATTLFLVMVFSASCDVRDAGS